MSKEKMAELFTAAVRRMDERYDPLLYRKGPPPGLSAWAHARWSAIFHDYLCSIGVRTP